MFLLFPLLNVILILALVWFYHIAPDSNQDSRVRNSGQFNLFSTEILESLDKPERLLKSPAQFTQHSRRWVVADLIVPKLSYIYFIEEY